ncbi:MAG: biotin/lipoyl-binding protein [Caldilineaceae bacterium]|nr:biotin/lipoyl-binding protein [Caldilinea sp.]MCB0150977.1 biotin/lipoyl-binding protein [Caldilineaceae bacterium]MCB9113829.1 biotin/lipoyl-binding protein [Caldilineaceae bacterium]
MARTIHLQSGEVERAVVVEETGGGFVVRVGEHVFAIAARGGEGGRLDLEVDGRRLRAYAVRQGAQTQVALDGETWRLERTDPRRRRTGRAEASGSLQAAMPGRVLDVLVAPGAAVTRGDTLVLLEAMKMELRIQAPADGQVARVLVTPGAVVERGQVLVELE